MNRYERLYAQLGLLLRREPADLEIGERLVLKANDGRGSTAMMDLVLEVLAENPKLPGTRTSPSPTISYAMGTFVRIRISCCWFIPPAVTATPR